MSNETKLWQLRAGIISEGEYQETVDEAGFNISKNDTPNVVGGDAKSVSDLANKLREIGLKLKMMKGIDGTEIKMVGQLLDNIIAKIQTGNLATALNTTNKAFSTATKNVQQQAPAQD